MSRFALLIAAPCIVLLVSVAAIASEPSATTESLTCDIGPLNKTYGKSPWLVYSCNDGQTVVVVSAPGNPAMPFSFTLAIGNHGLQVTGEGKGRTGVVDAMYNDITSLSVRDVRHLIEETKQVKR
jgi:hypothetical protein